MVLKLFSFSLKNSSAPRLGAIIGSRVLDISSAFGIDSIQHFIGSDNGKENLESLRTCIKDGSSQNTLQFDDVTILPPHVPQRNVICVGKSKFIQNYSSLEQTLFRSIPNDSFLLA